MNRLNRKLSRPGKSSLRKVLKEPVLELDLAEKPQHLEVPKTPDTLDFSDSLPLSTPTTLGSASSILTLPPSTGSEHSRCTTDTLDISEIGRPLFHEPPPWDRSNELVWTRHISSPEKEGREAEVAFEENLVRLAALARDIAATSPNSPLRDASSGRPGDGMTSWNHNTALEAQVQATREHKSPYFQLPDAVRFNIMKYLLAAHNRHDKPIRMNHPVFLCEVWPISRFVKRDVESANYFDSLQSVLSSLERYTSVCPAMRADVLATLFLTRRFHVVYSPHVRTETQPAATHYMDRYGPLMASITLEVDFTKLAGGWRPECVHFDALWGLKGVKARLEDFVQHQLTRHNTTIRDLRVLVRRYHGFRPTIPSESLRPNQKENHHHHHRHQTPTTSASPSPSPSPSPPSTTTQPPSPPTPPSTPSSTSTSTPTPQKPTPYTSTAHIAHTLAPLKSLGPLVSTLTLTGVPQPFAAELISALAGRPLSSISSRSSRSSASVAGSTSSTARVSSASSAGAVGSVSSVGSVAAEGDMRGRENNQRLRHVCYRVAAVEYPLLEGQRAVVGLRAGGGAVVVRGGVQGEMMLEGEQIGEGIGGEIGSKQGRIGCGEGGKKMGASGQGGGGKGVDVDVDSLEEGAGKKCSEVGAERESKAVRRVGKGRTVRKLSRELGGLSLRAKTGRGREVVRVVDRSLDAETRKGKSPGRSPAQQGEERVVESEKKRSRVGNVARSVARRMASGGRKGLFGQY